MGKSKSDGTPQHEAGRELTAIKQLLEVDLNEVTRKLRDDAEATLRSHPSNWQLIGVVRQWAQALAGVCRKHARDCARVHESRNDRDPAMSAMGTILLALSDHLRLPADGALLFENWPAENALRDFVLEVCGAPIKLIDGELVRKPRLPRWKPKSSFARKIACLGPYSQEQSTEFLSGDETENHLRGLEESFRKALLGGLRTSSNEAVLESLKTPIAPRKVRTGKPKYRSKFRRAIWKLLLEYPEASTQAICAYVDEQCGHGRTDKSWVSQRFTKTKQHDSHLSIICQVKSDMGLG